VPIIKQTRNEKLMQMAEEEDSDEFERMSDEKSHEDADEGWT
jgi:hypothetical protein